MSKGTDTAWAKEFADFVSAYNATIEAEGLPLSEWQSTTTDNRADAKLPTPLASALINAPHGETLVLDRSQDAIREIDL
jgi:hypothetical protein